jgi:hypothetical protein
MLTISVASFLKIIMHMQTEAPIPLELETKPDSENRQGESEVNKLHVNNVENFQNPSEPTVSDQSESDKAIKGHVLDRYYLLHAKWLNAYVDDND